MPPDMGRPRQKSQCHELTLASAYYDVFPLLHVSGDHQVQVKDNMVWKPCSC